MRILFSRRFFPAFVGMLMSVLLLMYSGEYRDQSPVTIQRSEGDGATMKVVPVYYDARDRDVRERLFASIECAPYDILDEGTYTGVLFEEHEQGYYYLYVRYRCTEQPKKK